MNNIKFNEWQEMALKKDTEAIIRKLNSQEPVFFSICWEVFLAIGVVIIDHLFNINPEDTPAWIICAVIAILPPLIIIIIKATKWIRAIRKAQAGVYNIKRFVDCFDNQICYWVMMGDSYSRILANLQGGNQAEKVFLYQEGSYYNNKSIQALYGMKPVIDKVFSNDATEVKEKSLISFFRLQNILELIKETQQTLDGNVNSMESSFIKKQKEINDKFSREFEDFIKDVNANFSAS